MQTFAHRAFPRSWPGLAGHRTGSTRLSKIRQLNSVLLFDMMEGFARGGGEEGLWTTHSTIW
jgi:hypothetical protein